MKKTRIKIRYKYAVLGMLFGCCFPILASGIRGYTLYGLFNWVAIIEAQVSDPLLWIIDTVPIFLSLFAYFIGKEMERGKVKNQEIQLMNQHLKAQEQIALVGKMTAGIAHDLKNPLNFVVNFAEGSKELTSDLKKYLEEAYLNKDWSKQAEVLGLAEEIHQNAIDIYENGQRANNIVFDLMGQTIRSKEEFQAIDLCQLLETSIPLAINSFKANHPLFTVNIEKTFTPNLDKVTLNVNGMNRVFINLIQNACDALFKKQMTQENNYTPTLVIQTEKKMNGVQISIKDNGPGIPAASLKKIFTPFFTTKPKGQGNTGLGLSICHDIITKEHHGQLRVTSEVGKFTKFHIFLPDYPKLR